MHTDKTKIIFVNACVRGEASRTQKIANVFIDEVEKIFPNTEIIEKNLTLMNPLFLNYFSFKQREELIMQGKLDHPTFHLANEFASADAIVIAAPLWDLSFPAVLKVYLENISVSGITFKYTETGVNGMCRAKKLVFITTRGADFTKPPFLELEMGERYIRSICSIYGIDSFECISADGLDEQGADPDTLLSKAVEAAKTAAKSFL